MKSNISVSIEEYQIIHRIITQILPRDCHVYVFGSRATQKAIQGSDLDLAIDGSTLIPQKTIAELRNAFTESKLPYTVDVLDINAIDEKFRKIVDRQKVLWG